MTTLIIDHTKFEATIKRSIPVIADFEANQRYSVVHVDSKNLEEICYKFPNDSIFVTHIPQTSEQIAGQFPDIRVYLIEKPLNIGYVPKNPLVHKAWCWDDIYIFEYRS